jgi:hypothetical protein
MARYDYEDPRYKDSRAAAGKEGDKHRARKAAAMKITREKKKAREAAEAAGEEVPGWAVKGRAPSKAKWEAQQATQPSATTLDNSNTIAEIKAELKLRGLKVSGVKEQLLERLHDFDINGGGDVAMKQKATGGKRKRKSTAKSGGGRKRVRVKK